LSDDVERNLSPRTAAICPVYVYALLPEMDALLEVSARHGLPVYFDSAQGLGAEYLA
jgi:dTDP-4-amino-4,6-dideoxygalactose transaminase